ncbi:hypothetical protein [Luteolibacter soli]|uniref:Uncharacterized protein n=1 Tax=Luteolibacter soli TaxID=3135280 RepID=A0ABU9AP03_9BACT
MGVKEAVKLALGYVIDLFESEKITNVGLEEVEFDEPTKHWYVTVGFSRPWDVIQPRSVVQLMGAEERLKRSYKVVTIDEVGERVLSVKNREVGIPA